MSVPPSCVTACVPSRSWAPSSMWLPVRSQSWTLSPLCRDRPARASACCITASARCRIRNTRSSHVTESDPAEVLSSFIKQYYAQRNAVAKTVLLSHEIEEQDAVGEYLSSIAERKVELAVPQRGERRVLTRLAEKNAFEEIERRSSPRDGINRLNCCKTSPAWRRCRSGWKPTTFQLRRTGYGRLDDRVCRGSAEKERLPQV